MILPPPPLNLIGFWRSRKISATTYPPPLNLIGFWRPRKHSATTPPPLNRVDMALHTKAGPLLRKMLDLRLSCKVQKCDVQPDHQNLLVNYDTAVYPSNERLPNEHKVAYRIDNILILFTTEHRFPENKNNASCSGNNWENCSQYCHIDIAIVKKHRLKSILPFRLLAD